MAVPEDNYIIIRDLNEAQRLDFQHEMIISCQGYYLHPDISLSSATTNLRIAELATGTGIFLREIAATYPSAECHGFDISDKMFPAQADVPPNVQFHVSDIKKPFESQWLGYFDVVHLRLIMAAMRKEDWAPVLQNIITLLKPGGWIQWVEDDRAHSVRHAARPVAPLGAASGQTPFSPPKSAWLDRFNRLIMDNARADDMTYGYMNLDVLMKDPEIGNLEQVGCDVYTIDRVDDGGKLRRDWAAMGIAAVWSMLKSREEVGDKVTDVSREELEEGFLKDIELGAHYVTRSAVFTGRKKLS